MSKKEVASTQLIRAMRLYMEDECISALTLAGAAEEILGAWLCRNGDRSALGDRLELSKLIDSHFDGFAPPDKSIASELNFARNEAKHFANPSLQVMTIPWCVEARNMITRALENYWRLFDEYPADDLVNQFLPEGIR